MGDLSLTKICGSVIVSFYRPLRAFCIVFILCWVYLFGVPLGYLYQNNNHETKEQVESLVRRIEALELKLKQIVRAFEPRPESERIAIRKAAFTKALSEFVASGQG